MAAAAMNITLTRKGESLFEARAGSGGQAMIDGPPDLGGANGGMRPMEMFLASLASCSAMDVLHILRKQRQELRDLVVQVSGQRADAIPAVYEEIELYFRATGLVAADKLEQAVQLSIEKYCSVAAMLKDSVRIRYRSEVAAG